MKVSELRAILEGVDDDVMLVCHGPHDDYTPFCSVDVDNSYIAESTYSGYVLLRELTPELIDEGYCEEDADVDNEGTPCIILQGIY